MEGTIVGTIGAVSPLGRREPVFVRWLERCLPAALWRRHKMRKGPPPEAGEELVSFAPHPGTINFPYV